MNNKGVQHLFATRSDLEPGIAEIGRRSRLKYALCGSFDEPLVKWLGSLLDDSTLGVSPTGNPLDPCYLVMPADRELVVRSVPQRRGGVRYLIDQAENPGSITFQPGGRYGEDCLVVGRVATIWNDQISRHLCRDFARTVTAGFSKVRSYFLGPEALQLLDRGYRLLTIGPSEPREYDLKR